MEKELNTTTAGYQLLVESAAGGETDLVAATGFNIGVPSPGTTELDPKDLMMADGTSKYNGVELICYATGSAAATVTTSIYGVSVGGPPELITSLAWVLGDAVVSSGVLWADTCVPTSTHNTEVFVNDSGNDRTAKITFDVTGYRYLYAIAHTASGATIIKVLMRPY